MHTEPTTGVPEPGRPDRWLVPPWPAEASFSDVVRHFLRFHPWLTTNTRHRLAYFEGYRAALDAATEAPEDSIPRGWRKDMRECVGRCALLYRDRLTDENQRARRTVSALPPQASPRAIPARREMAS